MTTVAQAPNQPAKASLLALANCLLAGLLVLRMTPDTPAPIAPSAPSGSSLISPVGEARPTVAEKIAPVPIGMDLTDPAVLAEKMAREGYPETAIQSAIRAAVSLRNKDIYAARLDAIKARQTRWNPAPELPEAWTRVNRALINDMALAIADTEARLGVGTSRYTSVPRAKEARVLALEQSYREALGESFLRYGSVAVRDRESTASAEVRAEFLAGLQEALTPDEFRSYLRYDSEAAGTVLRLLDGVAITPEQYQRFADDFIAATWAFDVGAARPLPEGQTLEAMWRNLSREIAASQFLGLLPRIDGVAAAADSLLAHAGLGEEERVREFFAIRETIRQLRDPSAAAVRKPALAQALRDRITALAGPGSWSRLESTSLGNIVARNLAEP